MSVTISHVRPAWWDEDKYTREDGKVVSQHQRRKSLERPCEDRRSQRPQFDSPAALKAHLRAIEYGRMVDGDYRKGGYKTEMRHARH